MGQSRPLPGLHQLPQAEQSASSEQLSVSDLVACHVMCHNRILPYAAAYGLDLVMQTAPERCCLQEILR